MESGSCLFQRWFAWKWSVFSVDGAIFFDRVECHERTKTTRALAIAFRSSIHLQVLAIIDDWQRLTRMGKNADSYSLYRQFVRPFIFHFSDGNRFRFFFHPTSQSFVLTTNPNCLFAMAIMGALIWLNEIGWLNCEWLIIGYTS